MVIRVGEAATSSEKMACIMFMQETGILKTSQFFPFGVYQRFSLYIQQARKSDETQEAETIPQQSNVFDDDSNLLPLHSPKSEEHGMPDKAEKGQSNVPDDDSTLTPNHPQKCRKRGVADKAEEIRASSSSFSCGTAALLLFLLTFTAGVCPGAGNMCSDVQAMEVTSKGEVAIACPLTTDVNQIIQTIMIKYCKPSTDPEDVLDCEWQSPGQALSCMQTRFETDLIAVKTDRVLARLPRNKLEKGSYLCQWAPPGSKPFTNCSICEPEDPKTVSPTEASKTTGAPKPLPDTLGQRELGEPREKASAHSVDPKQQISDHRARGQHGGLVAAVVILSITVFCLLLAIAAMVVFFLHYRRKMKKTEEQTPEETEKFTTCNGIA